MCEAAHSTLDYSAPIERQVRRVPQAQGRFRFAPSLRPELVDAARLGRPADPKGAETMSPETFREIRARAGLGAAALAA